jgi:Trypsin
MPEAAGLASEIKPYTWPWKAAIFLEVHYNRSEFICSGTLIRQDVVLTSASCFKLYTKHSRVRQRQSLVVKLGFPLYQEKEFVENVNNYSFKVKEIVTHPAWKTGVLTYDADIALLMIDLSGQSSSFVRPICLPSQEVAVNEGIVLLSEMPSTSSMTNSTGRVAKVDVVSDGECFRDEPAYAKKSSNRTFCARNNGSFGTCRFDAGSGLYYKHDGIFYLGGIVATTALDSFDKCDLRNFTMYTKVPKFLSWITQVFLSHPHETSTQTMTTSETTTATSETTTATPETTTATSETTTATSEPIEIFSIESPGYE